MKRIFVLVGLLLALPTVSGAQNPGETRVQWTARPSAESIRAGERFDLTVDATIDEGWHLYSTTQPPGGPYATSFTVPEGAPFRQAGNVVQPQPQTEYDANFGIQTEFFSDQVQFAIPLAAQSDIGPGNYDSGVQVLFQVCNDRICLPPRRELIAFQFSLIPGSVSGPESSPGFPATGETMAAAPQPATPEQTQEITALEIQEARTGGFLPFLWLAMTMGAISLATPCVFPMIPITVSYFTKNAEQRKTAGLSHALVYSLGIIFTFTGLGLGLAALLGATGINQFAANPWINLLITAVFLGFALNLFGLYQFGVPSGLLTKLSSAGSGGGYVQTLLMGLTFTLTSFTCTVPFVGTVLVATSQGDWLWPAFGMLGFSVVFAAPFFVLALIPQLLTSLPKSGGWLNSVKVTMGFLEVAAAMKFLSNVDLVWHWGIFTREVVLSVWLSTAVIATAYLLGKFRLPHDTPVESLGVMRMTSAMIFLAIGFYLFTGLMGGSLGELDAFLPPRTAGSYVLTGGGSAPGAELSWHSNLDSALKQAQAEQKPVFIDFTGYTCTNCRWMEANIFTRPEVHSALQSFVRLQLYTDGRGREYEENQRYQREEFGTVALPLYAILDSRGKKLATFAGMTRKPEEFLQFLRAPVIND